MYEKDGEKYFVVDSHIHYWNGRPENNKNRFGAGFTACFYDYHKNLSPAEYAWTPEKFGAYTEQDLVHDLFEKRPANLTLLNWGNELVTLVVMGVVLGWIHP